MPNQDARPDAIDRAHLARQTAGDDALQRDVLDLFAGQMQDLDHLLAAADAAAGPPPDWLSILHRYKGAAMAVGAAPLAALLARTEAALASNEPTAGDRAALRQSAAEAAGEARRLIAAPPPHGLAKAGESH